MWPRCLKQGRSWLQYLAHVSAPKAVHSTVSLRQTCTSVVHTVYLRRCHDLLKSINPTGITSRRGSGSLCKQECSKECIGTVPLKALLLHKLLSKVVNISQGFLVCGKIETGAVDYSPCTCTWPSLLEHLAFMITVHVHSWASSGDLYTT